MTGNEIVSVLADDGSYLELHAVQKRGVLTGMCTLAARPLCFAVMDDEITDGKDATRALVDLFGMALRIGAPVIWRISNCESVFANACIQRAIAQISGVCPVIVLIEETLGDAASATAQMCDVRIHVAMPQLVAGCCDLCAADSAEALEMVRALLYALPGNCAENAPWMETHADDECAAGINNGIADMESALRLFEDRSGTVMLVRFGGRSTALVEMQENATMRGLARFIRLIDCYSLPLVWIAKADFPLQDAQLVHALAAMTAPKILLKDSGNVPEELFDYTLSYDAGVRCRVINVLELFAAKRECCLPPRKHDNMPL